MNGYIRDQSYDELEADYRRAWLLSRGTTIADEIGALPFAEYQRQLGAALDCALAQLDRADAQPLFLRIRPDVGWRGELHIQAEPPPDTWEPLEEYSYNIPILQLPAPDF